MEVSTKYLWISSIWLLLAGGAAPHDKLITEYPLAVAVRFVGAPGTRPENAEGSVVAELMGLNEGCCSVGTMRFLRDRLCLIVELTRSVILFSGAVDASITDPGGASVGRMKLKLAKRRSSKDGMGDRPEIEAPKFNASKEKESDRWSECLSALMGRSQWGMISTSRGFAFKKWGGG